MRRPAIVVIHCVFLVVVTALSALAATPVEVVATKATELQPAASTDYVAWAVETRSGQNVYAKQTGQSRFRVNPTGTSGAVGGIDGTTLIYQEYGRTSDIFFFDLTTKARTNAGAPINTRQWEYWPSVSGDWVLFGRLFRDNRRRVILYNTATDETRVLDETSGSRRYLNPGQVSGNFVAWEKTILSGTGSLTSCDVFLYDIANTTSTTIPNSNQKCQYAASVNPSGTVYYARSGFGCGKSVTLDKYPIGGPSTSLVSLRAGVDLTDSYALDNGDGTTDVFFDPGSCRTGNLDIKKVTDS